MNNSSTKKFINSNAHRSNNAILNTLESNIRLSPYYYPKDSLKFMSSDDLSSLFCLKSKKQTKDESNKHGSNHHH